MDPLSITASCLAVLGAAGKSGEGLKKLMSLSDAPDTIASLSNEVEALRGQVTLVQTAISSIHGSQVHREHGDAVLTNLTLMRQAMIDLDAVIAYQLRPADHDGVSPAFSKHRWLRASPKIEGLKQKICDARAGLDLTLTAMSLQIQGQSLQHALQIQSLGLQLRESQEQQQANQNILLRAIEATGSSLPLQLETLISRLDLRLKHEHGQVAAVRTEPPTSSTLESPSNETALAVADNRQTTQSEADNQQASFVRIDATMSLQNCPRFCRCRCHLATHYQTPRILKGVLGQLFFSYTGLLRTTPCDYRPCRKSANKSRFSYYFPTWLAARALTISGYTRHLTSPEASWTLKIPSVIPMKELVWSAAETGNIQFVMQEFARGLSPWICNEDGRTLTHYAANTLHIEMLQFLLAHGATLDVEDHSGETPISLLLSRSERPRMEAVAALSTAVEDLVDLSFFTELHASAALLPGVAPISDLLLQHLYMDVNTADGMGRTPLHWACLRGHAHTIGWLVEWGANSSRQDRQGRTPLHYAAWSDDADSVKLVLASSCLVHVSDINGRTAIFDTNTAEVTELLLAWGADINHVDHHGDTPLLYSACQGRSQEAIKALIDFGSNVAAVDKNGRDAILTAVEWNAPETLHALLVALGDSNATKGPIQWQADYYGLNALHIAALYASVNAVQVFMYTNLRGLNPLARDEDGDTPTDCFYLWRDENCTIIREPYEEEEEAWWDLMECTCRQNGIDFDTFEPEWWSKYKERRASTKETETEREDEEASFIDALEDQVEPANGVPAVARSSSVAPAPRSQRSTILERCNSI